MLLTDSLSCYTVHVAERDGESRVMMKRRKDFKGGKKNFDQVSIDQSILINVINNTPSVISLEEEDLYSIQPL